MGVVPFQTNYIYILYLFYILTHIIVREYRIVVSIGMNGNVLRIKYLLECETSQILFLGAQVSVRGDQTPPSSPITLIIIRVYSLIS